MSAETVLTPPVFHLLLLGFTGFGLLVLAVEASGVSRRLLTGLGSACSFAPFLFWLLYQQLLVAPDNCKGIPEWWAIIIGCWLP